MKILVSSIRKTLSTRLFKVMWVMLTVTTVLWSVLSGMELYINSSILQQNTMNLFRDKKVVSIKEINDGSITFSNGKVLYDKDIKEYAKTVPGVDNYYIPTANIVSASTPISEVIGYGCKFFAIVLGCYFCFFIMSILRPYKVLGKVFLSIYFILLTLAYILVYLVYSMNFMCYSGEMVICFCIIPAVVSMVLLDFALFRVLGLSGRLVSG